MKNIYPKPIAADTFEFVFLKDHPGRIVSNSDDPPKSFHSRDIFTPHKTITGAWKYLGRLDDRITLMNGEKVLPLPIEGSVRRHKLGREAVVFGLGEPSLDCWFLDRKPLRTSKTNIILKRSGLLLIPQIALLRDSHK